VGPYRLTCIRHSHGVPGAGMLNIHFLLPVDTSTIVMMSISPFPKASCRCRALAYACR